MSNWAVKKSVILDIKFPDLNSSEDVYICDEADKRGYIRDTCDVFVYHHHRSSPKKYYLQHKRYAYNEAKLDHAIGNNTNIRKGWLMLALTAIFPLIYAGILSENRIILYMLIKKYNIWTAFMGSIIYFIAVFARIDGRLTLWKEINNKT